MNTRRLVLLAALALLVAACGPSAAQQQAAIETQVAALMATQAAEDALLPTQPITEGTQSAEAGQSLAVLPADAACIPGNTTQVVGTVEEVYSGDSIKVDIEGADHEIRYIGIDAGDLPADVNSELVLGKQVILIMDTTDVDEYGRWPRYVIADGVFVNFELIRRGAAFVSLEAPDLACEQDFKDLRQ
jgi:endonuclease YncB( thermonuclease family)